MIGAYENIIVGAIIRGNEGLLMQVLMESEGLLVRNVISCMLQTNPVLTYKTLAKHKILVTHESIQPKKAFMLLRPFCNVLVDLSLTILSNTKTHIWDTIDEQIETKFSTMKLNKKDCYVLNKLNDCATKAGPNGFKLMSKIAILQYLPTKLDAPLMVVSLDPIGRSKLRTPATPLPWWVKVYSYDMKLVCGYVNSWRTSQAEFEKSLWLHSVIAGGDSKRYADIAQLNELQAIMDSGIVQSKKTWDQYFVPKIKFFLEEGLR